MDEKDDDRTVARIFYEVGVLERDLIPILFTTLGTGPKGDRIALACGKPNAPLSKVPVTLSCKLTRTL